MRRALLALGVLCAGLPAVAGPGPAAADDWTVTGSARTDFLYFRAVSPEEAPAGLATGATDLDAWFDARLLGRGLDAAVRFRAHQTSKAGDDPNREEIDRRHLAYRNRDLEIRAGNFYETFGNGLILRTLEQRFVTLDRVDRAFNLDRNLDGVRVRGRRGPVQATLVSGTPNRQSLSALGGATEATTGDLLQGGEASVSAGRALTAGFAYLRADQTDAFPGPTGAGITDLTSWRARGRWRDVSAGAEYATLRPRGGYFDTGIGRYARLDGAWGRVGWSLEGKSYRHFDFPYAQPPTLVRTHDSVLLNRATHVLLPDDERGVEAEVLVSPDPFTSVLVNLAGSGDHEGTPGRAYREVYLEGRSEREGLGAGRLGLDWSRDRIEGVRNRWTAAVELEWFATDVRSVTADLELQSTETGFETFTHQLLQLGLSRAGAWTVTVTGEHDNRREAAKRDWLFAALDLHVDEHHDITLGYGSRPAGVVCSGGYCFRAPAFDGAEFRLLSRF